MESARGNSLETDIAPDYKHPVRVAARILGSPPAKKTDPMKPPHRHTATYTSRRRLRATTALMCALTLATFTASCERHPQHGGTSTSSERAPQAAAQTGTISADPNPVPAEAGPGKTKINWSVNEGTGRVYVAIDGGKDELFSGRSGEEAPWIEEGHTYEFLLYAGEEHKTVLGSVKVTRSKQ